MADNFDSLPIIEFQDAFSQDTKPRFLSELKHALVKTGFFYLKNHPISAGVQEELLQRSAAFFNLSPAQKQEVDIANSKSFRGYTTLGGERTAAKVDERETFFVGFEAPMANPELPIWYNLMGPNQWPRESLVPGFRESVERYMAEADTLSDIFTGFVAEALDMDPSVFANFFQKPRMNSTKLSAYPPPPDISHDTQTEFQGVGPHKDGSFLTYLLQGTEHTSLEVQNKSGEWIPVPPIPGTLVINIGRSLEAITKGGCVATTHRANLTREQYSPSDKGPLGTRLSIPFFQLFSLDVAPGNIDLDIPAHIVSIRDKNVKSDAETFFEGLHNKVFGEAFMMNALTSHPEVGKRWYPEELADALRKQQEAKVLDDEGKRQA